MLFAKQLLYVEHLTRWDIPSSIPNYQRLPLSALTTFSCFWPPAQTVHRINIVLWSTSPNASIVKRRLVKKIETHFVVSQNYWKFFRPFVSFNPQVMLTTASMSFSADEFCWKWLQPLGKVFWQVSTGGARKGKLRICFTEQSELLGREQDYLLFVII